MKSEDWCLDDEPVGDEPRVTEANALTVIAMELRQIKRILHTMAFDPNSETVLNGLGGQIDRSLSTSGGTSVADVILDVAEHLRP